MFTHGKAELTNFLSSKQSEIKFFDANHRKNKSFVSLKQIYIRNVLFRAQNPFEIKFAIITVWGHRFETNYKTPIT